MMKKCKACNKYLTPSAFPIDVRANDGRGSKCKTCTAKYYANKHSKPNKKKIDARSKQSNMLRCRLRHHLFSNYPSKKMTEMVGKNPQEFRDYIESLFSEGMTWDNYGRGVGKWQLDHTMPLDSFNIFDPKDIKRMMHYSNITPMWASENSRKGNSI